MNDKEKIAESLLTVNHYRETTSFSADALRLRCSASYGTARNLNLIPVQGKAPPRKGRSRDGAREAESGTSSSISFSQGEGAVPRNKAKL
jgi:hypothetical protein